MIYVGIDSGLPVPMSAFRFDSTKDPDFHRCWDLMNLQPLWARDNISKGGINRWS